MNKIFIIALIMSTAMAVGCAREAAEKVEPGVAVEKAYAVKYGLPVGDTAPDFTVKSDTGEAFNLGAALERGPVALVFYRGGWCPYCQTQIRDLQVNLPEFEKRGARLVALSVDRVEKARETVEKEDLGFPLLSNPDAKVLEMYRLQLELDAEILKKYEGYGIDVEGASGETHHIIAVPAVFVISRDGKIMWTFVDEDYKVRAATADILKALDDLNSGG